MAELEAQGTALSPSNNQKGQEPTVLVGDKQRVITGRVLKININFKKYKNLVKCNRVKLSAAAYFELTRR